MKTDKYILYHRKGELVKISRDGKIIKIGSVVRDYFNNEVFWATVMKLEYKIMPNKSGEARAVLEFKHPVRGVITHFRPIRTIFNYQKKFKRRGVHEPSKTN